LEWLKQPREQLPEEWIGQNERWPTRLADVLALIIAWWITFTVVLLLLFTLDFNPIDIGAGKTFLAGDIKMSSFSYWFSLDARLILTQQVLWPQPSNPMLTEVSHLLAASSLHSRRWECLRS